MQKIIFHGNLHEEQSEQCITMTLVSDWRETLEVWQNHSHHFRNRSIVIGDF